jgi:phospholipid/cholesterol/gamma-HCH transport system substrate-binding protein
VRDLTGMLVGYSERIDALLKAGSDLATAGQSTMTEYGTLATSIRTQVDQIGGNTGDAVKRLKDAADGFARVSRQMDTLIAENRAGLRDFSGSGLYEFTQLMIEARGLVESLTRISQQLERDPARFLFGDRRKGYEIEKAR